MFSRSKLKVGAMGELGEKVLRILEGVESVTSLELAELLNEDHQVIVGAIKSLLSRGSVSKAYLNTQSVDCECDCEFS